MNLSNPFMNKTQINIENKNYTQESTHLTLIRYLGLILLSFYTNLYILQLASMLSISNCLDVKHYTFSYSFQGVKNRNI
jgi:hypothetical protein